MALTRVGSRTNASHERHSNKQNCDHNDALYLASRHHIHIAKTQSNSEGRCSLTRLLFYTKSCTNNLTITVVLTAAEAEVKSRHSPRAFLEVKVTLENQHARGGTKYSETKPSHTSPSPPVSYILLLISLVTSLHCGLESNRSHTSFRK